MLEQCMSRLLIRVPSGANLKNSTNSWGLLTGSAVSSMAFITLNMAVLAPIPRASVDTATAVKPGFLDSIRRPYRKSWIKVLIRILGHKPSAVDVQL